MYNEISPPLRLVLNSSCNGTCYFCHHEGCNVSNVNMSKKTLSECILAAKKLKIRRISLTGGEPTLRNDLGEIIDSIKNSLPYVQLGITTNGKNLYKLSYNEINRLDKINLSIVSFNEEIYSRFQKVNPMDVFLILKNFSEKTTINIVVMEENENELIELIDKCLNYGFKVDLLFEMIKNDIKMQKRVLALLTDKYGLFSIDFKSTPIMSARNKKLRIKSPVITEIIKRELCKGCRFYKCCPEKICSLRVFPNGEVSPCLNLCVKSSCNTTFEKIMDLYPKLNLNNDEIYSYFFDKTFD